MLSSVMTAARVVALCLGLAVPAVSAQTAQPTGLQIQVMDQSGAFIPDASIQVLTDRKILAAEVRANQQGEAALTLNPGQYTVSVRALGFQRWQTSIEMPYKSGRPIKAELIVGGICPPCPMIVDDTQQFRLERALPETSIAPEPLQRLSVPGHKLRIRERHRPTGLAHR